MTDIIATTDGLTFTEILKLAKRLRCTYTCYFKYVGPQDKEVTMVDFMGLTNLMPGHISLDNFDHLAYNGLPPDLKGVCEPGDFKLMWMYKLGPALPDEPQDALGEDETTH